MNKLLKYVKYFGYYVEVMGKKMIGKGNMSPETNGEFNLLRKIINNSGHDYSDFIYLDIGANVGENALYAARLGEKRNKHVRVFAFEPSPDTFQKLTANCKGYQVECINCAIGKSDEPIDFYVDNSNSLSGSNSTIQHYYLEGSTKLTVNQTTIDKFVSLNSLERVNFVKLDVEGNELAALEGAKSSLAKGIIDFIQIEYNQTWIPAGASLEKVMMLLEGIPYSIYRICKNELLGINSYHYTLEDFYYANLLIARDGISLPEKYVREVSPIIDPIYSDKNF